MIDTILLVLSVLINSLTGAALGYFLISLTLREKIYREVECKVCQGAGKFGYYSYDPHGPSKYMDWRSYKQIAKHLKEELCPACNGKGKVRIE